MTQSFIDLANVSLQYGGGTIALDHTNLRIDKGDFVALVGPSGCGKSTILKLVGGLLTPTSGAVIVGGREAGSPGARIHNPHAPRVRIGLAFQNPTMLPWLTIRENVMIPLKIVEPFRSEYARKKKGEFAERAEALLAQVGLKGFGDKRPWQLSGGMLQRASLCRALVHDPQLLLLDEPFGALDQFTREELWAIMQDLWITKRPTVLLVTHDLRESAYLANRICVMSSRPGRILEDRDVEFSRPRTLESSYAPEFATLVQELRMRIAHARTDSDAQEAAADAVAHAAVHAAAGATVPTAGLATTDVPNPRRVA
ncbi:nitrate ABC transporter ATP-binding protein [Pigmentiphaga litoralis]|uniref:ABC transporter ATP-binding protein n=1 Tax=Pigmentiphaga litoralis TaxID=516702 RepID=UPI001676227D|nr:ABC transporter ATP-binding protein [Pigmentiphaga litoralis]GGX37280.1 nitrate ABC transporter ATP-binding protein [Pigmentiphaga litoralis]